MRVLLAIVICCLLATLPNWALAQEKGYLGVQLEDLSDDQAEKFGLALRRGALVLEAINGGPAAVAGILAEDVILSIEGRDIQGSDEAVEAIGTRQPGTRLQMRLMRGSEERTLIVVLGRRPSGPSLVEMPNDDKTLDGAFRDLQSVTSTETAQMLALTAIRLGAKGELAALLRQQQHLQAQMAEVIKRRNSVREAGKDDEYLDLSRQHEEVGKRLAEFPEYSTLPKPWPESLVATQATLKDNEVVLMYKDALRGNDQLKTELWVFVITRNTAHFGRSATKPRDIERKVLSLRCGLDQESWSAGHCAESRRAADPSELAFDPDLAHELYQELIGDSIDGIIKGRELLIVPSSSLIQLPFHVLVTERPHTTLKDDVDFRKVAWLGRRQPITVLLSLRSLGLLRTVPKLSPATKSFVGFGNPLLEGDPQKEWQSQRANEARQKQQCPKRPWQEASRSFGKRARSVPSGRDGLAEVAQLRYQVALPETADELCLVGRKLGASQRDMRLGQSATEKAVRAMSQSGQLRNYRIIHFATHGAAAGEINGTPEPGLILTPPQTASEDDDGYLSASEIAQLQINAEWVILSACNTAAGYEQGGEPLSGLARAFFMAGAQTMLVSHWAVNSSSTVKLITGTFAALDKQPGIGRADAMRRSMVDLIDNGEPHEAHPAYWAPFIVVGEGGTGFGASKARPARYRTKPPIKSSGAADWRADLWRQ